MERQKGREVISLENKTTQTSARGQGEEVGVCPPMRGYKVATTWPLMGRAAVQQRPSELEKKISLSVCETIASWFRTKCKHQLRNIRPSSFITFCAKTAHSANAAKHLLFPETPTYASISPALSISFAGNERRSLRHSNTTPALQAGNARPSSVHRREIQAFRKPPRSCLTLVSMSLSDSQDREVCRSC